MEVLPWDGFWAFFGPLAGVVVDDACFLGLGGTPPYFSNSSWVELYLVAVFSLSIVFALSAC
jgi:hypothetical protein